MKILNRTIRTCLLTCTLLGTAANANAAAGPKGENNRLRFECSPYRIVEQVAHTVAGVIDWTGDTGVATLAFLRIEYGRPTAYSGYEPESKIFTEKEFKLNVILNDDGVNQIIRMKKGDSRTNDLYLTWKSDMPTDVPKNQYFVIQGTKYKVWNCHAVVRRKHAEYGEQDADQDEDADQANTDTQTYSRAFWFN